VGGVIDTEAERGVGGVVGTAWGAAKGVGAARGTTESTKYAMKKPRKVEWSDRQLLFHGWI
jgi:hypothetical protein